MILFAAVFDNSPTEYEQLNTPEIDENLFRRIGDEDPEALKELYEKTHRILYAYVLSMTKNHEDALDLVQDTYLKIRSAAHLYEPMGKPLAWMFTIAKNLTRNHFRRTQRFTDQEDQDLENDPKFSYVRDPEDRMVLESTMRILTEEERQIVILHSIAGFKHREMAENLEMPLATVLSKYHRALRKLRKHLEGEGGYLEKE